MRQTGASTPLSRTGEMRLLAVLTAVVMVVVAATHWPVLSAGAVSLDDTEFLFQNPVIQKPGWASARQVITEVVSSSTVAGYYEPLTLISLMADVALGGRIDNLRPFHRTSLALHVLNTALVIVLVYLLFAAGGRAAGRAAKVSRRGGADGDSSGRRWVWIAAGAGLLFGLHPLTVEPVAWVWERKTLLAAFFGLGALILYTAYARGRRRIFYAASLIAYVLAVMAKPTATPLAAAMLLLDYWPLARLNRRAFREKAPFFAIAAISAVITVLSTQRTASVVMPGAYSFRQLPLRVGYLLMFYLYKVLWPVHLSSVYVMPESWSLREPLVCGGFLGACVLAALAVFALRRTRAFLTGGLFFLVVISPTLGVVGYSWVVASDKYVYLPATGLVLILAWLLGVLRETASRRSSGVLLTAGGVAIVLAAAGAEAFLTRAYLAHWRDTESLYRHMLTLAPGAASVHANLGIALARTGRTGEADGHLREALRLRPEYPEALTALGNILAARDDLDAAIARHTEALRLAPSLAEARINLGITLARKGHLSGAAAHLGEAVRRRPHSALAHANLALVLMKLGRAEEAVAHWERAVSLDSTHPDWQAHLADALLGLRRTEQAIRHYRAVLAVRPDSPGVCNNLAWVLATRGQPSDAAEAVQLARRACEATGWRDATSLDTLAAAYAAQGRFAEAVETVRKGIDQAVSAGRQDLVADMNSRLRLYQTGRPYRDSAAPATASAPSLRPGGPTAGEAGYRRERDSRRIGSTSMP